jgi:uncharacterized protein
MLQLAFLLALPFSDVKIDDAFWGPRIARNSTVTIEANLHQCEVTGRIRNFAVAGKLEAGKHEGALYNDSDVYKVIEGIAYALTSKRDADLERRTDAIIDKIAAAQQPDGYLNTYYTLVKPEERWKNIRHGHELYCAGHLIEAAVAYHQATGKKKLLEVARRFADHICGTFGPGKKVDTSGHEKVELALVKLFRATKDKRYLDQAKFFLDVRGRKDLRPLFGDYAQDHKPVREQREVVGHAVRAMYLYAAMADVAALTDDAELMKALDAIWHDVVDRKMYLTGGIGPSAHNEGFTVPYDLPNDTAYAETCAALGMALWNHRMFLMTGHGKYADVLERVVYNGLLSGVSLGGDRFFYTNPLGSKGNHHRVPWFDCSCCPTNVVRYLPGMGERAYAYRGDEVYTVLYMGGTATVPLRSGKVKLTQTTNYPWDEEVRIKVEPEKDGARFDVGLRVPSWCRGGNVTIDNLATPKPVLSRKGFLVVSGTWKGGEEIVLRLPMTVRREHADPKVKANAGRVALMRGPLVYCLEGVDNDGRVRNLCLPFNKDHSVTFPTYPMKKLLGGVVVVRGDALAVSRGQDGKRVTKPVRFQAVPYYAWDNREPGEMVVWLPESPDLAELPGEDGVDHNGVRIRASHCYPRDTVVALNDGLLPKSSGDQEVPRMTWWDRRGCTEWVSYQFPQPRTVSQMSVYWFDDTGRGACRVPAEWRLLWRDGGDWKPVTLRDGSAPGAERDKFNTVTFEPVAARELKLEVKLKPGFSGGILEWTVPESK